VLREAELRKRLDDAEIQGNALPKSGVLKPRG
jgi:hypothetical protein